MNTLLLVDDERDIRETLEDVLRDEGFHVIAAADGELALDLLRTTTVDLVVSDVLMPNMTGDELVHAIRTSGTSWATVPIVLMSGSALLSRIERVDAFLRKPFTIAQLLHTLASVVHAEPEDRNRDTIGCPAIYMDTGTLPLIGGGDTSFSPE